MIHMQTGCLAGGVTLGCLCDHPVEPWGAALLGTIGGLTCVVCIKYITPWMDKRLGIRDTCDCMALHGICAFISVFASCISYQTEATGEYATSEIADFDPQKQAGLQVAGVFTTAFVGAGFGLVTGVLLRTHPILVVLGHPFRKKSFWGHFQSLLKHSGRCS